MSNTIDCSRVSHASCEPPTESSVPAPAVSSPRTAASESPRLSPGVAALKDAEGKSLGGSYECVNDCISSQGVASLVGGATVSVGCLLLPPACGLFIGAAAGSLLGACEAACEELESK